MGWGIHGQIAPRWVCVHPTSAIAGRGHLLHGRIAASTLVSGCGDGSGMMQLTAPFTEDEVRVLKVGDEEAITGFSSQAVKPCINTGTREDNCRRTFICGMASLATAGRS